MSNKRDMTDYINEVSLFHNYYYDYKLVHYKNAHTKIKIICPVHGVFEQTPLNHRRYGCRMCGKLLKEKDIINKLKNIHNNKYNYDKFKYTGMNNRSTITCLIHGDFSQVIINHMSGKGCPKCANNYKKDKDDIFKKLNIIHNSKYNYSLSTFNRVKDMITIICPKHGNFIQTLNNHLSGHGCPFCDESRGEKKIEEFLKKNNILFERQKKFENCKDKKKLPFDFYLPDYNICIEYDGEQHFHENYRWNNFDYIKNHDLIKDYFCLNNNIKLMRISYMDNIIERLKNIKKI